MTGSTPPLIIPIIVCRARMLTLGRRCGVGTVTNYVMSVGLRYVENREAIDVDADLVKISGHQAGKGSGQAGAAHGIGGENVAEPARRRIPAPVVGRRAHALDPATLLIDENRSVAPADNLAKLADEAAQPVRRVDVTAEDNEAPRLAIAKEPRFLGRQFQSGTAGHESANHPGFSPSVAKTRLRSRPA